MLDRLLSLLEVLRRLLLQLLELGLRELEERLVARGERVGREGLHRRLERAARFVEDAQPRRVLRAQHEPGAGGAEDEADQDSGDDHRARER